jgi:hypothetical protein
MLLLCALSQEVMDYIDEDGGKRLEQVRFVRRSQVIHELHQQFIVLKLQVSGRSALAVYQ